MPKTINHVDMTLTKYVQDLYAENYNYLRNLLKNRPK